MEQVRNKDKRNAKIPNLRKSDLEYLINEFIVGRNAERNRAIMKRRLIDGIYFESLAEEFDMPVRQIKNIVYTNTQVIIKHL